MKHPWRILVVDDNDCIHDDFRKILEPMAPVQAGRLQEIDELSSLLELAPARQPLRPPTFEIESAFNGNEAIEKIARATEGGRPFAAAFVDVRMPNGWDGVQTVLRMWEVDRDIQVTLCTAYSDYSWDEIYNRLGGSDRLLLLKKPFDPDEVKQLATAQSARWGVSVQVRHSLGDLEGLLQGGTPEGPHGAE